MALVVNSTPGHSVVIPFCKIFYSSYDPDLSSPKSMMASRSALVVTGLMSPLAAFFNAVTLLAFYKNPSLRKRASIFLIALAIVDLIKSAVASPLAHANKDILVKIAVAGCILSSAITITRAFTDVFVYPAILSVLLSVVATLVSVILIWWKLKMRSDEVKIPQVPSLPKAAKSSLKHNLPTGTSRQQGDSVGLQSIPVEKENAGAYQDMAASEIHNSLSGKENSNLRSVMDLNSTNLFKDKAMPSFKTSDHFPLEVKVIITKHKSHSGIDSEAYGQEDQKEKKMRGTHIDVMKKKQIHPGIDNSPVSEHIEVLDETDEQDDQTEKKRREKHIDLTKKKQLHPGIDNSPISEHIEVLDETNEQEDQKFKEKKAGNNKVKKIPTTTSNRYDKAVRSERKAAKIATFLALGLFFTVILPLAFTFAFAKSLKKFDPELGSKMFPVFALLSALVNPAINIGLNGDIRKACKDLIACW